MKPTYREPWAGNHVLMWSALTLGPLLQGQTRIAESKSAFYSITIRPRGFQCETKL